MVVNALARCMGKGGVHSSVDNIIRVVQRKLHLNMPFCPRYRMTHHDGVMGSINASDYHGLLRGFQQTS